MLTTEGEAPEMAAQFYERRGFAQCLGAVDRTQIAISDLQ